MPSLGRRATALLVIASACWGLDTTLSSYALQQLQPATLLLAETSVGAASVWLFLGVRGGVRRPRRVRRHLLLGAIEPGVAFLLFDLGLRRTSAVSSGILLATETIFSVVLAVLILGERATRSTVGAVLLGAIGVGLVTATVGSGRQTVAGDLLVLAGSAAGACYYLAADRIPNDDDVATGTAFQLLAAVGIAVAYALAFGTSAVRFDGASGLHVAVGLSTGVVGIAIPFVLFNRALNHVKASTAAITLNLVPVFAVVSSVVFLDEHVMAATLAGGSLVLLAVFALGREPELAAIAPA